jgi:hypothetical protein
LHKKYPQERPFPNKKVGLVCAGRRAVLGEKYPSLKPFTTKNIALFIATAHYFLV